MLGHFFERHAHAEGVEPAPAILFRDGGTQETRRACLGPDVAVIHPAFVPAVQMRRILGRDETARLVKAIRKVLAQAIKVGGTTLRDYVNPDGNPGYFRQKLYVYERAGEPCRNCGTLIRMLTQGQRSTYYCPTCQR